MSEENKTTFTKPSDREMVFTRTFDAPRELVFKAWTDPAHIVQWWGPRGFTTTSLDMDVRPGGAWRLVMHGPDGVDYHSKILYLEVVKPERLVYRHAGESGNEHVKFHVTVTFEPLGDKTRLTMQMVFDSHEGREIVIKRFEADKGAVQTLTRLGEHLAKLVDNVPAEPVKHDLLITRIFDAPRELVFNAWVDPKQMARWWGPKGFTNPVCEMDVRVGGAIRILMRAPNGAEHPMTGVFHEILKPQRLVFLCVARDQQENILLESLTTVTFADEGGKTKLTVQASAFGIAPIAAQMLQGMDAGWTQSLERLAELVAKS